MTAQRLVVHIGDFKTGSSSIQFALAEGLVEAQGVTWHYPSARTHNYLALPLLGSNSKPVAEVFGRLRDNMEGHDADVVLISAEMFSLLKPAEFEAVFRAHLPDFADTMRIVAYARPQGSSVLARYATQVKLGHCLTPVDAFYRQLRQRKHLYYYSRFGAWQEVFGDRFTLRPMVRDQLAQGDVVADFAGLALGTDAITVAPFETQNASPALEVLMALQVLHATLSDAAHYRASRVALGRRLSEALEGDATLPSTKPWMDTHLAQKVAKHYSEDAEATDQRFFTGTPLGDAMVAMLDGARPDKLATKPTDHLSRDQIRAIRQWARTHKKSFAPDMPKRKLRKIGDEAEALLRSLF